MPLSEPSGSRSVTTLGGGALMANYPIRNTGADTSIQFFTQSYDPIGDRLIIAGDNLYVGEKASADEKLIQATALPPNDVATALAFRDSGEILGVGSNSVSLGNAALTSWADITPPAVTTRRGVFTFAGSSRLYTMVAAGATDTIEFSDDDGANWSAGAANLDIPGIPGGQFQTVVTPSRDRRLVATATPGVVCYANEAQVNASSWNVLALINFLAINPQLLLISDDNTRLIVSASNGSINHVDLSSDTIADYPLSENLFRQTATNGAGPNFGGYVPALQGFLIGNTALELIAFLPDSDPLTMQQGFYMGDTMTGLNVAFGNTRGCVDGNGVLFLAGASNGGAVFVPGTG